MRSIELSRGLLIVSCAVVVSCVNGAGFNQNEREAGGGDTGVSVGYGEIAIDPTGKYLLSVTQERLVYAELATAQTHVLSGLARTQRVTFDHTGGSLFLTRSTPRFDAQAELGEQAGSIDAYADVEAGELVRYDVRTQQAVWRREVSLSFGWEADAFGTVPWLDVTRDDRRLLVAYPDRVELVDTATGDTLQTARSAAQSIVDVDITPDQKHVVITHAHTWEQGTPRTRIELRDLESFAKVELDVPNCSSELVITQDGKHAFLAPTSCRRDPVSVIDLESGEFVRNLPGFGPVAIAADGALAVAFMDADNVDGSLFDDPAQIPSDDVRYHLMLIDTKTLRFDVIALGDELPRYAVAPDGKLLLIDSPYLWDDGRIRLLDVAAKQLVPVRGPGLELDHYAMTRDSSKVYLLDRGLFTITLADRLAVAEPIDFTPTHLNITPDDRLLVLREDDDTLWLYGTQNGEVLRPIELGDASQP